jgi:hypothetical protein
MLQEVNHPSIPNIHDSYNNPICETSPMALPAYSSKPEPHRSTYGNDQIGQSQLVVYQVSVVDG